MSATDSPHGSPEIPVSLKKLMETAGSYDQLITAWQGLFEALDLNSAPKYVGLEQRPAAEILTIHLRMAHHSFSQSPHACDSAIKNIFDNKTLVKVLSDVGIPKEFLLQTVRIGAIKYDLAQVERAGHKPYSLDPDSNGYGWANGRLDELDKAKKSATVAAAREETERVLRAKETAITEIGLHMREPNFQIDPEHARLLQNDWGNNLRGWKAVLESSTFRESEAMKPFRHNGEHDEKEITPAFFQAFRTAWQSEPKFESRYPGLPASFLNIINPESGWHFPLIRHKTTKWSDFRKAAHSNMGDWF